MKKRIAIAGICMCMMLAGCQNPSPAQESQSTVQSATTAKAANDVLVDHDGIKIVSTGFQLAGNHAEILIEIDNQSAQDIVVQTRDFSVNGYMCRAALSQKVLAGKKANAAIRIFDDELSKNNMKKEDIRDAEFKINISTPDFTDIYLSDVIKRHFEP